MFLESELDLEFAYFLFLLKNGWNLIAEKPYPRLNEVGLRCLFYRKLNHHPRYTAVERLNAPTRHSLPYPPPPPPFAKKGGGEDKQHGFFLGGEIRRRRRKDLETYGRGKDKRREKVVSQLLRT